jgi:hypothetical protein
MHGVRAYAEEQSGASGKNVASWAGPETTTKKTTMKRLKRERQTGSRPPPAAAIHVVPGRSRRNDRTMPRRIKLGQFF